MRVAILRINERSWEMKIIVPLKVFKNPSSQSMVSISRWLVGSSSNNTRGLLTSARPNAALRNQPPESDDSATLGSNPSRASTSFYAVFQLPQVVVIQLFLNFRQFVQIFSLGLRSSPGREISR